MGQAKGPKNNVNKAEGLPRSQEGVSMFSKRIARILVVPAAVIIPASVTTVALTASVASAATDSVSCTKLTGTVNLSGKVTKGSLTGCSDTAATSGSGTFPISDSEAKAKITWKSTGTTTTTFKFASASSNGCPNKSTESEFVITGTVSASTGKAVKIGKGQPLSAHVCFNSTTDAVSLVPGTTFKI
jgi:hypothetical protein